MARNKLVGMIGKLSEDQVERLSGIAMEYLDLNTKKRSHLHFLVSVSHQNM